MSVGIGNLYGEEIGQLKFQIGAILNVVTAPIQEARRREHTRSIDGKQYHRLYTFIH